MQQKTSLLIAVLLGLALQASAHFSKGGDFCTDEKDRFDNCKPLVSRHGCKCSKSSSSEHDSGEVTKSAEVTSSGWVSGSGSGSGNESDWEGSGSGSGSGIGSGDGSGEGEWHDGEYCFILQVFLNFSITLDIEIREVFITWINKTQLEIVQNSNLTEYQILVEFYYSLEILFLEYQELEFQLQFLYIGDWGYVCDLKGLVQDIQTSTTEITIEEVIEIKGSSCPLTDALEECKNNVSDSADQVAIEQLIVDITVILKCECTHAQKMSKLFAKFKAFFKIHVHLKAIIFSTKIEGFGIIQSYFDLCATYWRIEYFELAVGGDETDCPLLEALDELWQNTSYSTSQRSDFKELHDKFKACITLDVEIDIKIRIKNFTDELYELLILAEWDISAIYIVEIKGYGSIYDLIYAYIYCTNNGIGDGEFSTEAPTTTSTSTTTSTTTTTTTTPTTTTTKPNGNCATVENVNVISVNITLLLKAIDDDQVNNNAGWNKDGTNYVTQFSGYKKRIYNYSVNGTMTLRQKFVSIKTTLTGFTTNTYFKSLVWAVFINTWGTIGQYCGCP